MKIFLKIYFLGVLIFIICNCSGTGKGTDFPNASTKQLMPTLDGYSIIFYKLDDYAMVFINDSLVFNSSDIGIAPEKEILVDLNPFLTNQPTDLKIELYNAECPRGCNTNKWEFIYELFKNGEGLEFISENSKGQTADIGLKLTKNHLLTFE